MKIKGFRYGRKTTLTISPDGLEIKTKGTILGSGKETEFIRYADIVNVKTSKDLVSGRKLIINTANDEKLITMLEKSIYDDFVSELNQRISSAKTTKTSSATEQPVKPDQEDSDPYQNIKKAKELLDIGAITEEEFNQIKQKYLANL